VLRVAVQTFLSANGRRQEQEEDDGKSR
jgi:hypothetical protein